MLTRIIAGVVGIAIATFVIQAGGMTFGVFGLALMLIGWKEYVKAFGNKGYRLTAVTGGIGMAVIWLCGLFGVYEWLVAAVILSVLAIMLETVLRHSSVSVEEACISVAGLLYIGLPFAHLIMLRFMNDHLLLQTPLTNMQFGCGLVWIMFIGTWASDSFAYFTGSAIGKNKLCPTISPNKTIEGFGGSVVGTTLAVAMLGHFFFGFELLPMAVLGLLISLLATLGDLVESVIKRYTGIKDSGNLIPGHGGVLDRFDSVLFTAPLVYYFVRALQLLLN